MIRYRVVFICDCCNAEELFSSSVGPPADTGLVWSEHAKKRGWTCYPYQDIDYCPSCTEREKKGD